MLMSTYKENLFLQITSQIDWSNWQYPVQGAILHFSLILSQAFGVKKVSDKWEACNTGTICEAWVEVWFSIGRGVQQC